MPYLVALSTVINASLETGIVPNCLKTEGG